MEKMRNVLFQELSNHSHLVCVYIETSSASNWLEAQHKHRGWRSRWRCHVLQSATFSVHTDSDRQHHGHGFSAKNNIIYNRQSLEVAEGTTPLLSAVGW